MKWKTQFPDVIAVFILVEQINNDIETNIVI